MRTLNATLAAFLFWLSGVHAEQTELFDSGNQAFAAGKPADAIRDWEKLAEQRQYSAPLFFNLGNAYFKENKTGSAILNYERALWLNPADPDARANLKFVRSTAGLFEPSREWWQMVPSWGSLDNWAWSACMGWFLFAAALVLRWWKPEAKWSSTMKPVIAVAAVCMVTGIASAMIRLPDLDRAVVLVADAPLRVAPIEKSQTGATLREGDVVRVDQSHGSFVHVETEDGKAGWATGAEVVPIISDF
jgi:hypothetical protein